MSVTIRASRPQTWLESLGDWTWPGQGGAAAEALPPPWIPSLPPRSEPLLGPDPAAPTSWSPRRIRRLAATGFASALAAACLALALEGRENAERLLGFRAAPTVALTAIASTAPGQPLPTLRTLSYDAAGSSIDEATYPSRVLGAPGSFLVYLPVGFASGISHYPVIYFLTGNSQRDTAFLEIGLQQQLDRLIAAHAIPPLIAVMVQGGPGANNWRNLDGLHYESYPVEVQELVDRMLPTIAARDARAVVGDSMGGYGAMNVALSNPYRFGTVESWIGFFNGLEGLLAADRPIIRRLGLDAFVYGAESDHIANPAEDEPWAASLRAAGADAHGTVYAGEHNEAIQEEHLASMLLFAGRALERGLPRPAAPRQATPRTSPTKATGASR